METRQPTSARAVITRHAVLVFYVLVFALSSGVSLILVGPSAFLGTDAELTSEAELDPLTYLFLLVANLGFALTALLVIALAFGRAGLRDLRSRLLRWRVRVRWYAVALLTAPLLMTAILGALSLTSKDFLPVIAAEDKVSLLVSGLVAGLLASFLEELGYTGLATHELSKRHGLLATGLIVGLSWCVLHVPFVAGTASGAVPHALYVAVAVSWLLPYRMLMVWVYGHTQSVLMVMLMHLSLVVCLFVLLSSPAMEAAPNVIFNLVFGATLWVLVAAVAAADRRMLSRPELDQPSAQARLSS